MLANPILKNHAADNHLTTEGYVVIPFLNETEIQELLDFYYAYHSNPVTGLYATAHLQDIGLRCRMNEQIHKTVTRAGVENFVNYSILGGSYIAKGKGSAGTLQPHQDWNIVDEQKYRSFNIWIPLVDLTPDNGTILVMPKSHLWLRSYRSANIDSAFSRVNDLLWQKMQPLYMKRGEALVYDHRLLHASGENKTDTLRLTAVVGMIPQGASMYYYHKAGNNEVEVFESNPDFFLLGNIFDGPKGLKSVQRFNFDFPAVDNITLEKLMQQSKPLS